MLSDCKHVFLLAAILPSLVVADDRVNKPGPYPNCISPEVPDELGNGRLARMGFVDVTAAPFSADPTGRRDATEPIQKAVVFAREHQMVTFFPAGTYLVRDTIECLHGRWDPKIGKHRGGRDYPCILVGDRSGDARPVIRLAPESPAFGDPQRPKYVLHFWSRGAGKETPRTEPQPNINMNQMLIGIDVAIGRGNPGAVAVRHRAAQGSSVQDCTIDARGGMTGLEGGAGSGGSHFNVTVIGGRIGADFGQTQPAPTIVGLNLIDQTEAAILYSGRQALAAVGCRIESSTSGPVIVSQQKYPHHGQISLVDSVIEFKRPGDNTAIRAGSSLTLHNVYIRRAATIVRGPGGVELAGHRPGWRHVGEFTLGLDPPPTGRWTSLPGLRYAASIYIDGRREEKPAMADFADGRTPPADLQSRHLWPEDLPSWQTPGAVNVKDKPYGARGDGWTDDADAIQRAVSEHEVVLLPKGIYRVSKPINLRPETKLLGAARCFTWLLPLATRGGPFADPRRPQPIVRTADDAGAETVVAFLGLRADFSCPGAYCLHWRSGRRSIYRAVNTVLPSRWEKPRGTPEPVYDFPLTLIDGHGGGRWYNFHQESWHFHGPNYRHLLAQGTTEPLVLYQCNPEHARSDANLEIRRCRFVSLYGVKGEFYQPIVTVRDSDHVRIFGYGGNAAAHPGRALFVVENTPNFLLTNLVDSPRFPGNGSPEHFAGEGVDPRQWHMLIENTPSGSIVRTRPLDRPVLYRRGQPRRAEPVTRSD